MYYVFRRSPDGYVSSINRSGLTAQQAEQELNRSPGSINGERCSFTVLLATDDWSEAYDLIVAERGKEQAGADHPDIHGG